MVLSRAVHPNQQPDPLAQTGQLGLKLDRLATDGEFSFLETEFGESVDKSSHEKPSPTNSTGLLLSPDSNPARSGQISMRSIQIWLDFDKIHRNLARFQRDPSRSLPPLVSRSPLLRLVGFDPKQITADSNQNRLDLWFSAFGGGLASLPPEFGGLVSGWGTNPTRGPS